MKKRVMLLLILLGAACVGFAAQLDVGTPTSFMKKITNQNTRASSVLTLPTCCGGDIDLFVQDYSYEEGYMLLSGFAAEVENSDFSLKADKGNVYGWIHFKDTDQVYRYSTLETGRVVVEQVPVSAIIAVDEITAPQLVYEDPVKQYSRAELPDIIHLGAYPGTDVNNLNSRPESNKIIYLDITRINQSDADIWGMWQYHASALSMFDVNVTTSKSLYNSTPARDRGLNTLHPPGGRSFCYVNDFGGTRGCTTYWQSNARGTGLTGSHEIGHLLGVLDAGHVNHGTYFNGLPAFKWVPLMGNYWMANGWEPNALYQWQKGEYSGATSAAKQDFFQYATSHLKLLPDDITTAIPLEIVNDNVSMVENYGRVGTKGDSDDFTFKVGSNAEVDITIRPIERLVMLDVHAAILDESGNVVVEDNKQVARSASLKTTLDQGTYTLRIKGGAEGTPSNGFSNYGSVGYFGIEGTITGGSTEPTITIGTPKSGDSYEQGNTCGIQWNDNIDGKVKITLFKGSSKVSDIATSTESDGLYEWTIADDLSPSKDYTIVVSSIDDPAVADTSDKFSITEEYIIADFPFTEDFDSLTKESETLPIGWSQETTDDINWTVWSGPTPSKVGSEPNVTGPDGGYPDKSGNYLYVEASEDNSPGKTAKIVTPKFKLDGNYALSFQCHMFSDSAKMGTLQLDVIVDGTEHAELLTLKKDEGDAWFKVEHSLADYQGDRVQLRFSATTGENWASDICIDHLTLDVETGTMASKTQANNLRATRVGNNVRYYIPKSMSQKPLAIKLYSATGRLVKSVRKGVAQSGSHLVNIGINELSSGYYICRISVGDDNLTIPMVKSH